MLLTSRYGVMVYAVPTSRNELCYFLTPDLGSGCERSFRPEGITVALSEDAGEHRLLIVGITSNDVASVAAVRGDGRLAAAEVGSNAFLILADTRELTASSIDALSVTYRNGGERRVVLE